MFQNQFICIIFVKCKTDIKIAIAVLKLCFDAGVLTAEDITQSDKLRTGIMRSGRDILLSFVFPSISAIQSSAGIGCRLCDVIVVSNRNEPSIQKESRKFLTCFFFFCIPFLLLNRSNMLSRKRSQVN